MDSTEFWHADRAHGLELLKASHTDHVYPRHMHGTFVVEVVEAGVDEFFCNGHLYNARAGSIVLINPLVVHTGRSAGNVPLHYRSMYPTVDLMNEIAERVGLRSAPMFPKPVIHDPSLSRALLRAHIALERSPSEAKTQAQLLSSLTGLVSRHAEQGHEGRRDGQKKERVGRVVDYMCERYAEQIDLEHLARISGLSPFHFLRIFRREIGLPPHAYLTNVRIEQAKALLRQGMPIVQVAYETGFCDQSHLTRNFKRMIGVTPGQYIQ